MIVSLLLIVNVFAKVLN